MTNHYTCSPKGLKNHAQSSASNEVKLTWDPSGTDIPHFVHFDEGILKKKRKESLVATVLLMTHDDQRLYV